MASFPTIQEDDLQSRLSVSANAAVGFILNPDEILLCLTCQKKFKAGDKGADSMSCYCAICNETMVAMMTESGDDGMTMLL